MDVFLSYKLYSPDLEIIIEKRLGVIPPKWKLQADQFAVPSLFYKRMLARIMLVNMINKSFSEFQISKADHVDEKLCYDGLSISISYTGNFVIVAVVASGIIGIDVEKIGLIDFDNFRNELTEEEWEHVNNATDKSINFYTVWTRKEAVLKADGRGLKQELSAFSVLDDLVYLPFSTIAWYLSSFKFLNDYLISIASKEKYSRILLQESRLEI